MVLLLTVILALQVAGALLYLGYIYGRSQAATEIERKEAQERALQQNKWRRRTDL